MTPQDREIIDSVFTRLARLAGGPKDREAEAFILERLRAVPDSAYNLVEAVVSQEGALKAQTARIQELEGQLARLPAPQGAAGFGQPPQQQPTNPWGRGSVPQVPPQQPQYAQQQQYYPQQQQPGPWGQPSAGGSFLRTAAGAAVGVAGGMLLAQGVSSMFGGGHAGGAFGGGAHAAPVSETSTVNNYYGSPPPAEPAQPTYDTSVADSGGFDDGGGFDGGGEF